MNYTEQSWNENGGLKMIDLESMIKSLRLAWLKRIFQCNNGAWRSFLRFSLEPFGGLFFLFYCNYDIKEIHISSKFYPEILQWWSEFVVFSLVEGNVNIFCGITKRYVLVISLFSIKKKTFWTRCHFHKWSFVWIRHHKFFYYCFE